MAVPKLTREEREGFLAQPHTAVLGVAADEDLPAEQARAFVQAELQHPQPSLILFTTRPRRWLSADFGEQGG